MAKIAFTAGRIERFTCPPDKPQAFLWDETQAGLGLRTTPAGKPAYVFQGTYMGRSLRITIGSPSDWRIPDAQAKARAIQRLIDEGRDPRMVKATQVAADVAQRDATKHDGLTVGDLWLVYIAERRPHWGDRHAQDHVDLSKAGGESVKRGTTKGKGKTVPGPLHPLLALRLVDLTEAVVEAWAAKEARTRPTRGRLALRVLKAFLNWVGEQAQYKHLAPTNPARTRRTREALGKPAAKVDVLQRSQLRAWFSAVRGMDSGTASIYLQCLLLVGCRPGEMLGLRWEGVDKKWRAVTIVDKVEGVRVVPLTPYVGHLLDTLPRPKDNPWVFASPAAGDGVMSIPRERHVAACKVAGIEGLSLHGLRRSFRSLTEWIEVPVGVVAQIQGHKPSATVEKHYAVRPLDLLRQYHEKIEAWILQEAGIEFEPAEPKAAAPAMLRVVGGTRP